MRAFVTGAAGFAGGSLVRQLVARGDSVIAAVRDPARSGALAAIGCEVIGVDLASAEELVRASAGVTYWFTDARARAELGYAPRDLDASLRTLLPGVEP